MFSTALCFPEHEIGVVVAMSMNSRREKVSGGYGIKELYYKQGDDVARIGWRTSNLRAKMAGEHVLPTCW